MKVIRFKSSVQKSAVFAVAFGLALLGCGGGRVEKPTIQNAGSDTMVNVAQAWAEAYAAVDSSVSVEVSGGGSGTGIAALINGTADIANSSRAMEPEEIEKAKQNNGVAPVESIVGYDALAVYVHKDNPLERITIAQLADIFGEGGTLEKWSQLGVVNKSCANDEIIRVSRQSNSGTYHYFREAILGKNRDFKLGSRDMNGSKDVVELVSKTPCAIGYSGLGYNSPDVKIVPVAKNAGDIAYMPSIETTWNHTYPIARPLYMYTPGMPTEHTQKYLDWIHSDEGQKVVEESGYIPIPKHENSGEKAGNP